MAITKLVTRAIADDAVVAAAIADDAVVAAAIADDAVVAAAIADDAVVQAGIADDAVNEARLQVSNTPTNGYFLSAQSGNTGGLTWAESGGAYSSWLVKDADGYTASDGDQIICNAPTTAFTITLPSGTTVGRTVTISNIGAATVTVARNSQPINSTASDATLLTNRSTQLVYVTSTIGWKELP